jgi:hypothetical protein
MASAPDAPDATDRPETLTADEALALLPDRDVVHTLTWSLIGADWERARLEAVVRRPDVERRRTRGVFRAMGHGLALVYGRDARQRVLYVETKQTEQEAARADA